MGLTKKLVPAEEQTSLRSGEHLQTKATKMGGQEKQDALQRDVSSAICTAERSYENLIWSGALTLIAFLVVLQNESFHALGISDLGSK